MTISKKTEFIVITIIIILTIICSYKKKNIDKINIENPYTKYSFYKEENQSRYELYKLKNNYNDKKTILYVNIGLDKEFYTNIKPSKYLNTKYILVNKYNFLEESYIPNDLIKLNDYSKENLYLNNEAYESFKKMALDARLNNLNIRIISAYRSYEYQKKLYSNYLKIDPQNIVDTYSARSGHSEHQTGLAIDIDNTKTSYTNFENTNEFEWIKNNCYKYGFILRYPKDKEHITGYIYEPWHYRYVGTEISEYIYKNNLAYEEYYYEFID